MTVNVRLLKLLSRGALPCLHWQPFDSSVRAVCAGENGTSVVLLTVSRKTYARMSRRNPPAVWSDLLKLQEPNGGFVLCSDWEKIDSVLAML